MFNFTTQTVVNELLPAAGKCEGFGLIATAKGADTAVRLSRGLDLNLDGIKAVYVNEGYEPEYCSAEIDLSGLTIAKGDIYRIALYIQLTGSENSYYANALTEKGKPLFIEAKAKTTAAADLAETFVNNAKKYELLVFEKELLAFENDGAKITVTGLDEHQVLTACEVQKLVQDETAVLGTSPMHPDLFETVIETEDCVKARGKEGFGTYSQMIKDLRLPTAWHTRWDAPLADEMPVPGVIYDQVTIHYCQHRGVIGGAAVGQLTDSLTKHVFYVAHDLLADFVAPLEGLDGYQKPAVKADPTDGEVSADTVDLADPTQRF